MDEDTSTIYSAFLVEEDGTGSTFRACLGPTPAADGHMDKSRLDRQLRHQQFGQSSERGAILDQLELQLNELQENASEAEAAAQLATATAKGPALGP